MSSFKEIIRDTNESVIAKAIDDLKSYGIKVVKESLFDMSLKEAMEHRASLFITKRELRDKYGAKYVFERDYSIANIMSDLMETLVKVKKEEFDNAEITEGYHYRNVRISNGKITGERVLVSEGVKTLRWKAFKSDILEEKARNVLFHGDDNDFRKLYVVLANGLDDPLGEVSMKHITESTKRSKALMEQYCDKWVGTDPWPWEDKTNIKVEYIVNEMENEKMKQFEQQIAAMRKHLVESENNEGAAYDLVDALNTMLGHVKGMVDDLSKISTSTIGVSMETDVEIGNVIRSRLEGPINDSIETIGELKNTIDGLIDETLTGAIADASPDDDMGDMGDMGDKGDMDELDDMDDQEGKDTFDYGDQVEDMDIDMDGTERPEKKPEDFE